VTLSFVNGKWYEGGLDEDGDLVTGAEIVPIFPAWKRAGVCNTESVELSLAQQVHAIGLEYIARNGHSPTGRELALLANCALSTAHRAIAKLEAIGLVSRRPGEARNLQFLK